MHAKPVEDRTSFYELILPKVDTLKNVSFLNIYTIISKVVFHCGTRNSKWRGNNNYYSSFCEHSVRCAIMCPFWKATDPLK